MINNNTNEENSFEILPDEIVLEITSFLPSIDLIFSLSNVCKSWRKLVLPIIKQHYEEFALPNNSTSKPMSKYPKSLEEFHSDDHENDNFLFQADFRKFIKTMLRKHIYQVAERWINAKLELGMSNGIIDLSNCNGDSDQKVVKQLMSELDLITEYFSHFSDFTKKEEDISEKTPNKKEEKEEYTSSGNSVFKGIVDFLSSFFSQPTQSPTNPSTTTISNRFKPNQVGKTNNYYFKCSLLGDSGVGKTSLINCIIYNSTFGKYAEIPSTIGIGFFTKKYQFSQDKTYDLQIWDLNGSDRFQASTMRFRNLHVVFLMFDLTDDYSLQHVPMWYEELKKWDGHFAEIILIGNKTDLVNRRCIKKEQAQQIAFETLDGSLYVETTNSDIKHAHTVALYSMILRYCILRNIEGGNKE